MIQSGDTIGPYTLVRTLGRGAFGEVWLAERRSSLITTQVALKLPLDAIADLDAIRNEAQIWLKASGHTNIVPVLDAEVYEGRVVIASEYVAGGSLQDWLLQHGGKAPSVEAAVNLVRGILAGLEHLHQNGLIHRDLKPGNVLLQGSTPRLTDFGLTRVLKPNAQTTNLAGTPGYMAPEAFKGQYSPASDVWAAGTLLHEILTGAIPYPQADFYALLLAITSDEPVVLSNQVPDVLRPVLTKALAKSVNDRFASAGEMADALLTGLAPRSVHTYTPLYEQRNNLPLLVTSFIGRESEIIEIKSLLERTRLLTLMGSGGCGKTRLSLQVATDLLGQFPDGVWLVELAPLSDPGLAPQAVAQVLGIKELSGQTLQQTLIESLKAKKLLLVLDNCEHLITACATLTSALLRTCPMVTVLVTTRERLGVSGEQTYRVPSLSLPDPKQPLSPPSLSKYESVRLFIARAMLVNPDFAVTDGNAPALAQLCNHLDGIPMAIELAAARARFMPVEDINARLDNRFRLLTGGDRTALPRQQTLRAAIDWSFDLLNTHERLLLARLSVFAGGATLSAVEQVCTGEAKEEHTTEDGNAFDVLTSLVDKNLVIAQEQAGVTWYRLLETMRQYAGECLTKIDNTPTVRWRHCDYYLHIAEAADAQLIGANRLQWLDTLEREHDNLRAALDFCASARESHAFELRLAGALWNFWRMQGHWAEGRSRMMAILAHNDDVPTRYRARVLLGTALLTRDEGYDEQARVLLQECLRMCELPDCQREKAWALSHLGDIARQIGSDKEEDSFACFTTLNQRALALFRQIGDKQGIAQCLRLLAVTALPDEATHMVEESLALSQEIGDTAGVAAALSRQALRQHSNGNTEHATILLQHALALYESVRDRQGMAQVLGILCVFAAMNGVDVDIRIQMYRQALALCRECGDKKNAIRYLLRLGHMGNDIHQKANHLMDALTLCQELKYYGREAVCLDALGKLAQSQGESATARAYYIEALELRNRFGQHGASSLDSFAVLYEIQGQLIKAVRIWGAMEAIREQNGEMRLFEDDEEVERKLTTVRSQLGEAAFTSAWDEGHAMSWESAVEYALEEEHNG